jgi:phospholipid/cholesterol/gamma-HCH transport system substrate-binding protein
LLKYNPEYTCLLVGAKFFLDHGGYSNFAGNGRSLLVDAGLLFGGDTYKYGPGGTPLWAGVPPPAPAAEPQPGPSPAVGPEPGPPPTDTAPPPP